ncbi:MAG: DR2241 family protein [Dehalococcoidia bacterium]
MRQQIGQLELGENSIGVPGERMQEVAGNREALFHHIRNDDAARYRPLTGAKTLPTGWSVDLSPDLPMETAIETVYPLATVHRQQYLQGTLRVVTLDEVLSRQSGRYESSSALSQEGRARAIDTVCDECVRRPVWSGAACTVDDIPCPEPCSVMVAFCREAALWEAEPPRPAPANPHIAWAAFDEPGNELRERYLEGMTTTA